MYTKNVYLYICKIIFLNVWCRPVLFILNRSLFVYNVWYQCHQILTFDPRVTVRNRQLCNPKCKISNMFVFMFQIFFEVNTFWNHTFPQNRILYPPLFFNLHGWICLGEFAWVNLKCSKLTVGTFGIGIIADHNPLHCRVQGFT